jgi:hypothetical protein
MRKILPLEPSPEGHVEDGNSAYSLDCCNPSPGFLFLGLASITAIPKSRVIAEQIISPLLLSALRLIAGHENSPIGKGLLLSEGMGIVISACINEFRNYILSASISLIY